MITNLVFFFVIAAGSVYGVARFEKRFEEMIPISVMGMVIILYLFGLMGYLRMGMIAIYAITIALYTLSVLYLMKERRWQSFFDHILTPGAILFAVLFAGFSIWNYGRLASGWDEFTHWVDVVKAVTTIDDFATNPAANSHFQSYPPGMMLFQYSMQKVHQLVMPDARFCEWQVFFCYQVFILAVMMPFFCNVTFKQLIRLSLYGAITLLAPLLFYRNLYSSVYIDAFVGILFGVGMAMVVLHPKQNGVYTAYICLLCVVLTLSKDVGVAFSLAIALAYGIVAIMEKQKGKNKAAIAKSVTVFISSYLPKLMWDWEIYTSKAQVSFNSEIDWEVLMRIILGLDNTYRTQVVHSYSSALFNKSVQLGHLPASVSYVAFVILFAVAFYVIYRIYMHVYAERRLEQCLRAAVVSVVSMMILIGYIIGLCVIYIFKFSEYEALQLASMDRYLNIAFVGVWMLILLLLADGIGNCVFQEKAEIIMLLVICLCTPVNAFFNLVRRTHIAGSVSMREPYKVVETMIRENCDGDDRIYFIAQETTGYEYWVCRFSARPNSFNDPFSWSIGESFYEGDVWTLDMSQQQWAAILFEQYDYVVLYKTNDYFVEHFGSLFESIEKIDNNALYRVNRETGLLERCGDW